FVGVVGNIGIGPVRNRIFAEQRIAVVAVVILRIQAVDGLVRFAGKEFMLGFLGPMAVALAFFAITRLYTIVLALHFLQENQVGMEGLDRMAQGMHAG